MIKLYRGEIKPSDDELVVYQRNDNRTLYENEAIHEENIKCKRLFSKVHYFIIYSSRTELSISKVISMLEVNFPNIIWTKVTQKEEVNYKFEFSPSVGSIENPSRQDAYLISALSQMNLDSDCLGEDFIKKIENIISESISTINESSTLKKLKRIKNQLNDMSTMNEVEPNIPLMSNKPISVDAYTEESVEASALSILEELKDRNKRTQFRLKKQKTRTRKKILSILIALFVLTISYFSITSFYSVAFVQGDSMKPTIKNNDILFVQKYPHTIQRGDLISFQISQLGSDSFVKRVVGLPGDKVEASGGALYINGKIYDKRYTKDFDLKEISGRETVPEKKFFVLGDNRSHSTDSRNFGFVDTESIKGKVINK